MSHPFIQESIHSIGRIIKIFPLTIFWALIVTGGTLYGSYSDQWKPGLVASIMTGGLGLAASMVGHVYSRAYPGTSKWRWIIWISIWLLLGLNFWYWYGVLNEKTFNICSAVLYSGQMILLMLLVSSIPFWKKDFHNQKLLTYNRKVFTSYVFTALLSSILYIALSLAVLVVDNLFKLNIDGKIYLYLMVFIAGLVWTGLFLNSYPEDYQDDTSASFPAFRFIIQYIGIPVVIVYAIILIFYASANIFLQQQMEEWILWLILWFYILGFLVFCLNYSIKDAEDATWGKWFYKWYLWGSIPILMLNIIGLWKAISDQGVSELTYILATFSVFLLLTAVYLLWSENKDFRMVLGLLFILVMISTIGPFNMCRTTINSQLSRLEEQLINQGILQSGQLITVENVKVQDQKIITGKLDILSNRGSLDKLTKWDDEQLLGEPPYELNQVCEVLGLSYVRSSPRQNIFIQGDLNKVIEIKGYEKIIPITPASDQARDSDVRLEYEHDRPFLHLVMDGEIVEEFNLESYFEEKHIQEMDEWVLQSEKFEVKIHIQFAELNDNLIIVNMGGIALLKTNNHEN